MRRSLDWHLDAKRRLPLPALDRRSTQLVAALGFACVLWATLFAVMDVLHPGIALRDRLGVTLLSVVLAMATGWLVLAGVLCHAPAARGPSSSAAPARPRGARDRRC